MEAANLNIDFYRVFSRKPLSRNWVSEVFGCPRNPIISHPAGGEMGGWQRG